MEIRPKIMTCRDLVSLIYLLKDDLAVQIQDLNVLVSLKFQINKAFSFKLIMTSKSTGVQSLKLITTKNIIKIIT